MAGVTISVRGTKEARQLLDSLSGRELQNRVRRGTRAGAKVFREEVRRQAKARPDIPDSFAKTATKGHRNPVGTSTGPTSPLLNIFEPGAGRHHIYPKRWRFLSNFSDRRRQADRASGGPFFAYGPVTHPGMDARPLIGPVFEAKDDEASKDAIDSMLEGLR